MKSILSCAVFIAVIVTAEAYAHKVIVFAWVDGDTIYTESKFSGGRKVKNGLIFVYGPKGKLLLEGKTDE
ncbi:MAG: hypothetical protein GY765_40250, partial [bacterium]|nr:hypothetical protein [bacterium]